MTTDELGKELGEDELYAEDTNRDLAKQSNQLTRVALGTAELKMSDMPEVGESRDNTGSTVLIWGHNTLGVWGSFNWGTDSDRPNQYSVQQIKNPNNIWKTYLTSVEMDYWDDDGTTTCTVDVGNLKLDFSDTQLFQSNKLSTESANIKTATLTIKDTNITKNALPNPLAHYKLNDDASNTTITDDSGNGHNGTATSNTDTLTATGKVNAAIDFNETDKVDLTDNASFEFAAGAFTIAGWIYINSLPDSNDGDIFSKWGGAGKSEHRFKVSSAGKLVLSTSSTGSNVDNATANTALSLATWYHVAVVKSSTTATFYVNGVADGSGDAYATLNTGTTKAYIAGINSANDPFPGRIDDLRVYNAALNIAQIKALYNGNSGTETKAPTADHLVYELSADDGSNYETVTNGTLHNFTNQGTNLKLKITATGAAGAIDIKGSDGIATPIKIAYNLV